MADTLSLTLTANGADIEGDSTVTSLERADTIEVLSLEQTVSRPFDRATLQPTGRRIYAPIRFTKRLDRSTPRLRQALINNEVLAGHFRWFRPDPDGGGTTEHFMTLRFTQGRLTRCALRLPDTLGAETASLPALEEIELTVGTIEWEWEDGGVVFTDTVNVAP
jgi:type VI secretion system secreted protein Hcp